MKIELVEKNARIPVESLAYDIRKQWLEAGAITKEEEVIVGMSMENGKWFINLTVRPPRSKIIRAVDDDGLLS